MQTWLETVRVQRNVAMTTHGRTGADMGKGKDKPSKQTKKPKSEKPKGAGSAISRIRPVAKRAKSGARFRRESPMHCK
jgi:hypothetical protein